MNSDEYASPNKDPGVDDAAMSPTRELRPGEDTIVIGPYLLIHRIGVGGMGDVWLAEQREPIRRRVAVKLIKAGMDTREVIARFETERQTLALMDHPAIAKVLDAGSTPQGAPYFVMEYVAGVPITAYCDKHKLNTRDRLELFVHVCEGVQHAHQKAVIHRDLKPSNILVAEVDNKPAPKIIDFGIAKAMTGSLIAETFFTSAGAVVGTPEYMSPEQALSSGEDIDTRTDVYSLGIVLYELLTGALPLNLKNVTLNELLRRLQEEEAPKPSTKVRKQDPTTSAELARCRQADPITLANQLQGELDSILLKALEKDRSRRYASAADFGDDIGRYLRNEGVLAVPPSTAYRARKFIRRHRAGLATLTAFMLILIAAAVVSTRESIVAKRQRDRADSEAAVAKAVNEFLQNDLLSQADSGAQDGSDSPVDPEVKVRTLLDRAAGRVEKRFAGQPLVESQIQDTIGQAYLGLGLAGEAEKHLRRAYDLSAAHRGADAPETLGLLLSISEASAHQDKYSDAVIAAKAAYEGEARTLGAEDPKTVVALQNLAVMYIYTNQYTEAEPLLKKALNIQQRLNGYDNLDTLNTSDSLAELYIEQSRYAEARPLLTKGLESYLRVFGSDHPYTDRERFGLGKVLYGEGNYKEAEKVFAECLANEVRVRGKLHPDTLTTTEYLGESLVGEGDHARGIPLLEGALRDFRKAEGPGVEDTLRDEAALGKAYDSKGDLVRAEQNLRTAVQGLKALGKDQEDNAADAEALLGLNLVEQRKYPQAEPVLRDALTYLEKRNKDDWRLSRAQVFLGAALNGLRRYPESEKLLLNGQRGLEQHASRMPADQKKWIRFSEAQIVEMYSNWDKRELAAQWQAKLQEH